MRINTPGQTAHSAFILTSLFLFIYRNVLPLHFYFSNMVQTVHVLRHQWAYSCEKAKRELDYNPRSLKDGLEEVLPWLKSLGLIKY